LKEALAGAVTEEHVIVEGAAAAGPAAILAGGTDLEGQAVAVILTGANIDRGRLMEVLAGPEGSALR